jgi:hypothetical protein
MKPDDGNISLNRRDNSTFIVNEQLTRFSVPPIDSLLHSDRF